MHLPPNTEDLLWTPGQWPQQNLEVFVGLYTLLSAGINIWPGLASKEGQGGHNIRCLGGEERRLPVSSGTRVKPLPVASHPVKGALSYCRLKASDPKETGPLGNSIFISIIDTVRVGPYLLRCRAGLLSSAFGLSQAHSDH